MWSWWRGFGAGGVAVPGKASPAQKELLRKTLQSHVFSDEERETILNTMDWYNTDEAKANIDWVLHELKERKRAEAANELMKVIEQNREYVSDEMYEQLKALSENKDTPPSKYFQIKEEFLMEVADLSMEAYPNQ
ncbi:hypothetical protein [Adhaeribacter aquaticus]|uniref:hypothetical protein n=1 Tax=Adhaeribacter aquaticus TaxID=299567 RepID=UPI000401E2AD|nr:hypothetical protein [Adhaeribacter aquaticus]